LRSAEPWKAYRIFLLVAVGMKIASLLLQLSIRTRARSSVNEVPYSTGYLLNPRNWAEFMSGGRPFLMLTLLLAGTGFFRSITSPFRNLYLFNEVGFSAATVGTLAVVELTITAVAFPLWARLAKPLGYAAVLWLCLLGFILDSVLWASLPVSSSSAFYAVKAWGALCATGFGLSMYTLQLDLMPKQHGAAYLSLAITVDAICGAVAPMLFGAALQVGPSGVIYQLGFLTTAGGVLMVMLVLWSRGGRWGGTAPRVATLPAGPLSPSAVVKLAAPT
jgi:Na+/melibiose symporter-like transporter